MKGFSFLVAAPTEPLSPDMDRRRPSFTSVMPAGVVPNFEGRLDRDAATLMALGYRQEFKREFSLWTTFCVSFAVLGLLPSFATTLYYGLGYAGTGGMAWGWLVAWFFIQCVAMGMAELCSSMPTRCVEAPLFPFLLSVDPCLIGDRAHLMDTVAVFTMLRPSLRLRGGAQWLLGSLGGLIG